MIALSVDVGAARLTELLSKPTSAPRWRPARVVESAAMDVEHGQGRGLATGINAQTFVDRLRQLLGVDLTPDKIVGLASNQPAQTFDRLLEAWDQVWAESGALEPVVEGETRPIVDHMMAGIWDPSRTDDSDVSPIQTEVGAVLHAALVRLIHHDSVAIEDMISGYLDTMKRHSEYRDHKLLSVLHDLTVQLPAMDSGLTWILSSSRQYSYYPGQQGIDTYYPPGTVFTEPMPDIAFTLFRSLVEPFLPKPSTTGPLFKSSADPRMAFEQLVLADRYGDAVQVHIPPGPSGKYLAILLGQTPHRAGHLTETALYSVSRPSLRDLDADALIRLRGDERYEEFRSGLRAATVAYHAVDEPQLAADAFRETLRPALRRARKSGSRLAFRPRIRRSLGEVAIVGSGALAVSAFGIGAVLSELIASTTALVAADVVDIYREATRAALDRPLADVLQVIIGD